MWIFFSLPLNTFGAVYSAEIEGTEIFLKVFFVNKAESSPKRTHVVLRLPSDGNFIIIFYLKRIPF